MENYAELMVYFWAIMLLILNILAWLATAFMLPGNWLVFAFAALYAWLLPLDLEPRVSWAVVIVLGVLAIAGELLEFLAGAAGAAKQGGSRRGVVFAILGTFVGSLAGAFVSIPIPIIGPIIGALFGGALGAFGGAWLGEHNSGRTSAERIAIGKGAMTGRLLGTAGKLMIGILMVVLVTLDSFFDLPQ